jgi:hypothetical protein
LRPNQRPADTPSQVFRLRQPSPTLALWLISEARLLSDVLAGRTKLNEEQIAALVDRTSQALRAARQWRRKGRV